MCIAFWTFNKDPKEDEYSFILAFNRDEYFDRPTRDFHIWEGTSEDVYAPKDLKPPDEAQRGSWLGVNRHGHLAFLTNFREQQFHHDGMISRGALVRDFLLGGEPPSKEGRNAQNNSLSVMDYAKRVYENRHRYDGFNLVLFDLRPGSTQAVYVTNRGSSNDGNNNPHGSKAQMDDDNSPGLIRVLDCNTGDVMGLSNSTLSNPWPKVSRGIDRFSKLLSDKAAKTKGTDESMLLDSVSQIMHDSSPFSASSPPSKLKDLEQCIFVPWLPKGLRDCDALGDSYGTRTTDILLLRRNSLIVSECNYNSSQQQKDLSAKVTRLDLNF
ncbi:hypothetical protein H4217_006039 [Coemansia sp. RSA 1939]|nr:hypothetical protein H4217_006039 [Coemansia sp. RSA 1939]KAJ2612365.1 hypothetical protein EV177_003035 [Coemansia sp. RSA 1804]